MAYYTALINAWNSATQPPAGVTGAALTGLTRAQKLAAVNAWTVTAAAKPAILSVTSIINAIVPADLLALTTVQLQVMSLLLEGSGTVDASIGTTVRGAFQSIFAGKTVTLSNLSALVAPFDSPASLWWQANSYLAPINSNDLVAAGSLT